METNTNLETLEISRQIVNDIIHGILIQYEFADFLKTLRPDSDVKQKIQESMKKEEQDEKKHERKNYRNALSIFPNRNDLIGYSIVSREIIMEWNIGQPIIFICRWVPLNILHGRFISYNPHTEQLKINMDLNSVRTFSRNDYYWMIKTKSESRVNMEELMFQIEKL